MLDVKRTTPVYDITTCTRIILQNSDKKRRGKKKPSPHQAKKPDIDKYFQDKSLLKVFTCDQLKNELAGEIHKLQIHLKEPEILQ